MAPPDVEVAAPGDTLAVARDFRLFDRSETEAADGGSVAEHHQPHQAVNLTGAATALNEAPAAAEPALHAAGSSGAPPVNVPDALPQGFATAAGVYEAAESSDAFPVEAAASSSPSQNGTSGFSQPLVGSPRFAAAGAESQPTLLSPAEDGAAEPPGDMRERQRRPSDSSSRSEALWTATEAAATTGDVAGQHTSIAADPGNAPCGLEYVYVGQDCFFVELPDGALACVAGLENLPSPPPSAAGANDAGDEGIATEEQIVLARLQCHNCLQLLEFDSRAYFVQCSSCMTLNAVQNQATSLRGGRAMIVICGRCSTRNISCLGSVYVECWQCHTVCQVDYPTPAAPAGLTNGQGSSHSVRGRAGGTATAAAAEGEPAPSAARPTFFGGRSRGFFGANGGRGQSQRPLQGSLLHAGGPLRRAFWRADEEDPAVSAAGREARGTRLSTAVELPPALTSHGQGRSLLARHSFNPMPPRNTRPDGFRFPVDGYRSSNASRDDTASRAATTAALPSSPPQPRVQRLLWSARPATARADAEPFSARRSDAGNNSSGRLLVFLRLPFRRSSTAADARVAVDARSAAAGSAVPLTDMSIQQSREEVEEATTTRRRGRNISGLEMIGLEQSSSNGKAGGSDAGECLAANITVEASEFAAARHAACRRSRQMQGREGAEETGLPMDLQGALYEDGTRGEEGAETFGRRTSGQTARRCSSTEDGNADRDEMSAGQALESFHPCRSHARAARRRRGEAATRNAAGILKKSNTQDPTRDTTSASFEAVLRPSRSPSASGEDSARAGGSRAPKGQLPAEDYLCFSDWSRTNAAAPVDDECSATPAATRRPWMVSFAGAAAQAYAVGRRSASARTDAAAQSNGRADTTEELQTDITFTPSTAAATGGTVTPLKWLWRGGFRPWRSQEPKEMCSAHRPRALLPRERLQPPARSQMAREGGDSRWGGSTRVKNAFFAGIIYAEGD